jgi:hypothetical protein
MLKPLITIENWTGGNTLNRRLGNKNNIFRSFGLDLFSRPGSIIPTPGFIPVTDAGAFLTNDIRIFSY